MDVEYFLPTGKRTFKWNPIIINQENILSVIKLRDQKYGMIAFEVKHTIDIHKSINQ
jgi:hypothetical protein